MGLVNLVRGQAVLSIDLESFTHTPAYRNAKGTLKRHDLGISAISSILSVLDRYNAKATFFVVSELAERQPHLINRVADAGHEIASHTRTHRHLSNLNSQDIHQELQASREKLASVSGTEVIGFRAPSFDLAPNHFDEVATTGYRYDSSVVPSRRIPGWYGGEFDILEPGPVDRLGSPADLTEIPIGVMPGVRLPLSGAWLRFFGIHYTLLGMDLLARREIAPVLYFHPWEFVDLPTVSGVPKRVQWRTGEWMYRALNRILRRPYEFIKARQLVM